MVLMSEVFLYTRTRAPKRLRTTRTILTVSYRVHGTHPTFEGGGVAPGPLGGVGHNRAIHSSHAYKSPDSIARGKQLPSVGLWLGRRASANGPEDVPGKASSSQQAYGAGSGIVPRPWGQRALARTPPRSAQSAPLAPPSCTRQAQRQLRTDGSAGGIRPASPRHAPAAMLKPKEVAVLEGGGLGGGTSLARHTPTPHSWMPAEGTPQRRHEVSARGHAMWGLVARHFKTRVERAENSKRAR